MFKGFITYLVLQQIPNPYKPYFRVLFIIFNNYKLGI